MTEGENPMFYGKYEFSSIFENDALLPPYKGSTFRGIFGHALKEVVCALKRQECAECLLKDKCVYAFVFETPAPEDESERRKRMVAPPHPYVIEPPETTRTHYHQGDSFDFCLILFGRATDYLPYFIYAFDQMGKLGVGKRTNEKKGAFSLRKVTANSRTIYSGEDRKIKGGYKPQELALNDASGPGENQIRSLEISLKTPLRLKFQNRLEASLPFHVLTRAMLRRVSALFNYYGDGEPLLDYQGIVARAKAVEIRTSSLQWFDWRRYSSRQDQSMLMGGMVGKITYAGNLTEFLPLIRFCEKVHLGKQTSFGLGKIELTGLEL